MKNTTTNKGTNTPGVNNPKNNEVVKTTVQPETKKVEETAVVDEKAMVPLPKLPKTISEQLAYFEGLESLVNQKRKLEKHHKAVTGLKLTNAELDKFEHDGHGLQIRLLDGQHNEYAIANPRLVKEMRDYLLNVLSAKVAELEERILNYSI